MPRNEKKWFKSAFADNESIVTFKRPRTMSAAAPAQTTEAAHRAHDSIDLTLESDDVPVKLKKSTPQSTSREIDINFKSSNWIENFAPKQITDLAIHAKKITDMEEWFYSIANLKGSGPILLINGPSGCGKTAALKVLAKQFDYSISEWITPVDVEYTRDIENNYNNNIAYEKQSDKFSQFLFQSSRYASVFDVDNTKRLVLVEDFPNTFIRDPTLFNEILERYTCYGKSPLVFIVTDTKSKTLNISYNLFPDAVRQKLNISNISFNSVSDTLLKKGLSRICGLMSQPGFSNYYTEPDKPTIEAIAISSQGDIRNAVINLHFASQKGAFPMDRQAIELKSSAKSTKKTRNNAKNKLKSLGCDETITVMHALGRIFNPKFCETANETDLKLFLHSPEDIANTFLTQPRNMLTLTHTNYLCHFRDIENVVGAANILTESDVLLNEWQTDLSKEMALIAGTRGLMVYNEKPVTGWMPIRSSKQLNSSKYEPAAEMKSLGINAGVSTNTFATDYRFYTKIIKSKKN